MSGVKGGFKEGVCISFFGAAKEFKVGRVDGNFFRRPRLR